MGHSVTVAVAVAKPLSLSISSALLLHLKLVRCRDFSSLILRRFEPRLRSRFWCLTKNADRDHLNLSPSYDSDCLDLHQQLVLTDTGLPVGRGESERL